MTRIAIYGGTFDPIHIGHLEVAMAVIDEKAADKLIFMPNYISPFKQDEMHSSGKDRVNMINIAIKGAENIDVSDYEIKKESPSYTIDTLEAFKNESSEEICFVAGADSICTMEKWHRGSEILSNFKIIAVKRADFPIDILNERIDYYQKKYGSDIVLLDKMPKNISSSIIRENFIIKKDCSRFLIEGVKEYIIKKKLYNKNFHQEKYIIDKKTENKLKKSLKKNRYSHSIGVAEMAKKLALIYGADEYKAYYSGYIHDIAKCLSIEESNRYIRYYGLDYKYLNNIQIAHSKIGAKLVEYELGVKDKDIINAISFHTTARADMSLLEEILYVSDAIEINRKYSEVKMLRKESEINLDKVCLFILDFTIEDLNKKNKKIDSDTLDAREWIIEKLKRRNNE